MASQQQNDSTSPRKGGSGNLGQTPGQRPGQNKGQMPGQKQGQKAGQNPSPKLSPNLDQQSVQGTADDDTGYEQTGFQPDRADNAEH